MPDIVCKCQCYSTTIKVGSVRKGREGCPLCSSNFTAMGYSRLGICEQVIHWLKETANRRLRTNFVVLYNTKNDDRYSYETRAVTITEQRTFSWFQIGT